MSNEIPKFWREKLHDLEIGGSIPLTDKSEKSAAYAAAYKIYKEDGNVKKFTIRCGSIFRKADRVIETV